MGTTDNFTTGFLHFFLFSTALLDFVNSRPVHFLMLSSHFSCLVVFPLFNLPSKMSNGLKQNPKPGILFYVAQLILFLI